MTPSLSLAQSGSGQGSSRSVPKKEREIHGVDFRVVNWLFQQPHSFNVYLYTLISKDITSKCRLCRVVPQNLINITHPHWARRISRSGNSQPAMGPNQGPTWSSATLSRRSRFKARQIPTRFGCFTVATWQIYGQNTQSCHGPRDGQWTSSDFHSNIETRGTLPTLNPRNTACATHLGSCCHNISRGPLRNYRAAGPSHRPSELASHSSLNLQQFVYSFWHRFPS